LPYDELLRITDRYPHRVEIKGGFRAFLSREIYITSNEPIEKWYKGEWYTEERISALRRRIDENIVME
jgi:hypothetical protein